MNIENKCPNCSKSCTSSSPMIDKQETVYFECDHCFCEFSVSVSIEISKGNVQVHEEGQM